LLAQTGDAARRIEDEVAVGLHGEDVAAVADRLAGQERLAGEQPGRADRRAGRTAAEDRPEDGEQDR
jgi:hypothetical protein